MTVSRRGFLRGLGQLAAAIAAAPAVKTIEQFVVVPEAMQEAAIAQVSLSSFNAMLDEYLCDALLYGAIANPPPFLKDLMDKTSWQGGSIPIPFEVVKK